MADLLETDSSLIAEGVFTVEDIDRSDVVSASVVSVDKSGSIAGIGVTDEQIRLMLSLNSASTDPVLDSDEVVDQLPWVFNSGADSFDYLADGEVVTLTYTLRVTDSAGSSADAHVTINITGTNDGPSTSVVDVLGSITESSVQFTADHVLTDDPGNMVAYEFSSHGGQLFELEVAEPLKVLFGARTNIPTTVKYHCCCACRPRRRWRNKNCLYFDLRGIISLRINRVKRNYLFILLLMAYNILFRASRVCWFNC